MKHHYLNPENTFQRLLDEYRKYGSIVVAVDFDNTLYDYHKTGLDCSEVIDLLQHLKSINCTIALWTASEETDFIQKYCAENAVPVDLINENPVFFQSSSRKIYYNELLDDRSGMAESFHRLSRLYETIKTDKQQMPTVFLGGTCNGSNWREQLIPMLHIPYFNPVTTDWTAEKQDTEKQQRAICDYNLFTITPKMAGVFSIAEVVEDSVKQPRKTILCLLENDENASFTRHQWKSLLAVAEMVAGNGATVCYSLLDVAQVVNVGALQMG